MQTIVSYGMAFFGMSIQQRPWRDLLNPETYDVPVSWSAVRTQRGAVRSYDSQNLSTKIKP